MYFGSNLLNRKVSTLTGQERVFGRIKLVLARPQCEDPIKAFLFMLELEDGRAWCSWANHCTFEDHDDDPR